MKIKEPEGYRKKGKGQNQKICENHGKGSKDIRELIGGRKKVESSERSSEAFEGQGFVLGTRSDTKEGRGSGSHAKGRDSGRKNRDIRELLGGRKKGESSSSQKESSEISRFVLGATGTGGRKEGESSETSSGGFESGAFEGQGIVLGTGGLQESKTSSKKASQQSSVDNLRANMLKAAEQRRSQNEKKVVGVLSCVKRDTRSGRNSSDSQKHPAAKKPRMSDCIVITDDEDSTPVVEDSQSIQVLDLTEAEASPRPPSPLPDEQEWYRHMEDYKTCPVCGVANIPSAIINLHISLCLEAEEELTLILDDDDL